MPCDRVIQQPGDSGHLPFAADKGVPPNSVVERSHSKDPTPECRTDRRALMERGEVGESPESAFSLFDLPQRKVVRLVLEFWNDIFDSVDEVLTF